MPDAHPALPLDASPSWPTSRPASRPAHRSADPATRPWARRALALVAALGALGLSACGTNPSRLDVPGIAQSDPAVQDLRPASEKEAETFSFLIISEDYAIYRLAENRTEPTGVRLLAHRARQVLPQADRSAPIKIHHLVIYNNIQATLRRGAIFAGTGAIGSAIARAATPSTSLVGEGVATTVIDPAFFEQTAQAEAQRGRYTEAENPQKLPTMTIYVDAEIGGRRFATRTLVLDDGKDGTSLAGWLDRSITNHLALFVQARRP